VSDSERPSVSSFPLTNNSAKWEAQTSKTEQTPPARARTQARPRNAWTYTKLTLKVLLCLFFMAAGAITGNFYLRSSLFRTMINEGFKHPIIFITHRDPLASFTPERQFPYEKQHVINVLVLGCDRDYEDRRPVPLKTPGRSDVILLARINFDQQKIEALSIPRDTLVRIPDHGLHKINAAHAIGGPELTKETIKSVFGIDTDYYVTVDFDGFQKIVDAVGGVDLTVEKQLDYDDNWGNLHIHLKPGYQHLNGYHAMGYVRMRHSDNDLMRSQRQHEFLEALRKKVTSPKSFMKLPDVLNALTESIKTDLTQEQLLTLGNFARQLPKEKIALSTLPVIEGPSYVYVKTTPSAELVSKMFFDSDLPIVSINVPDRSSAPVFEGRRSRRRRHRPVSGAEANVPRDDNGEPLDTEPNDIIATPEGASGDNGSAPTSDQGDTGATRSGGSDSGTDRGSAPDTGKSGGDSSGSGDSKSGGDAAPPSGGGSDSGSGSGTTTGDSTGKSSNG